MAAEARLVFEAAGLSDRCETAGADFFAEALPGADVYVLAQLGRRARVGDPPLPAAARSPKAVACWWSSSVPEGDEPSYGKLIDVIMLTLLGGRERTEAEWRTLLREGGFELAGVTTGPATSLVEAAPA